MECSVCLNYWNSQTCVPKSLPCGHSYCSVCLTNLIDKSKNGIICPSCQVFYSITEAEVMNLPKNFSLLALINDSKKIKTAIMSPKNLFKNSPIKSIMREDIESEEIDSLAGAAPLCEKHNKPVHSYIPKTKTLLCEMCLPELPKEISSIRPIPLVCQELRHQLVRAKNVLWNKKAEIKRYKAILISIMKSNEEKCEETINNHIQTLKEILNKVEGKIREINREAQQRHEEKIRQYIKLLETMYDKMISIELEMGSMDEKEDSEIVLFGKEIEKLIEDIASKKINISGEGMLRKFNIDSSAYVNLEALLHSQIELELAYLQLNGKLLYVI